MRLAIGLPLVVNFVSSWALGTVADDVIGHVAALSCGSLLLVGLLTPVVSIVWALTVVVVAISKPFNFAEFTAALVPLSLAVLGPGAWSIDARIYGRKRIRV